MGEGSFALGSPLLLLGEGLGAIPVNETFLSTQGAAYTASLPESINKGLNKPRCERKKCIIRLTLVRKIQKNENSHLFWLMVK